MMLAVFCATVYSGRHYEAATLAGPEPTIETATASVTNWVGLSQQFSVTAGGVPPFSYQ